jgi:FAD/FMN-containing dehydrogenase
MSNGFRALPADSTDPCTAPNSAVHDVSGFSCGVIMKKKEPARARIENFGGNIQFTPQQIYAPRTEADVLEILNYHSGGKIRPVAGLHSWSDVILAEDVLVAMHNFNQLSVEQAADGSIIATVGAGLTLKELIPALREQAGMTLPVLPGALVQTLVGCISTATHGSGTASFSNYVTGVRMAAYDPNSGEAAIYDWESGPELRAARCAMGFMGIILSVKIRCVPDFSVLQKVERCQTMDEVLSVEKSYPLQEFALIPYRWSFVAVRRRPIRKRLAAENSFKSRLYRAYAYLIQDVLAHLALKLFLAFNNPAPVRWLNGSLGPILFLPGIEVIDSNENSLTRRHELFQHVEMELFVPASHLRAAVYLLQELLQVFAGEQNNVSPETTISLNEIGLLDELRTLQGTYTHHYPIYFRRVLPEDALISMTGNAQEAYYTISLFSFTPAHDAYYGMARYIAQVFNHMYGAFPHWGKHYPLWNNDIEMLFPELELFRSICHAVDPDGVFLNDFAQRVLGFTNPVGEAQQHWEAP